MAEAVVSVLLDNLLPLIESEVSQLLEFDDQFEETKKELEYVQSYLKDVDQVKRKERSESLKTVMSNLRELVYDAEDVIADCQLLFHKKHQECAPDFTSYCSPTLLKSRRQLGKRLRKINQDARMVNKRMVSYLQKATLATHKYEDGGNMPLTYPIQIDEAEMIGLEDDSAKITNWILKAHGLRMVIGIVGMGGIGKTTLAQKICNNESVKNTFKHKCFVTVSQSIKLDKLLEEMLTKLKVEKKSLKGKGINELLDRLKTQLDERYLVVLDDIWGTDEGMWWERLKSTLPLVEGSCVIVTTRNEDVAKSMGATDRCIHRSNILSKDDSWSLFSKVVFDRNGGMCMNLDLEKVGREIVARCGGLPLAIKVVGGMVGGKGNSIHEWSRILEHLPGELANSKKDELVISRLELSYEELPTHFKPCFLCLAMFPEDFEISVRDMVDWWIGEGFVCGRNGKTAFEIGEECLVELFNRFLILGVEKDAFERRFLTCKMHDMVRDMVIKIARQENFMSLDHGGRPEFSDQSRRVGIVRNTVVESIENSSKLRTLVGMEIESKEIIASVKAKLCKVRWLRVLSLSLSSMEIDKHVAANYWLSGIGSLQHLVYLDIAHSALRTLPDSIGNLHNLQILCLFHCPNLERLPMSITTLEKLTAIEIRKCWSLECMPEGLGKLSKLERLMGFRPVNFGHKNGSGISQLKNLTSLRELQMEIKEEEQIKEEEWDVLSMLERLQFLWLNFKGSSPKSDGLVRKVDRQLSPLKYLRELCLWHYPGKSTPAWLSPTSLPNLQFLSIYKGSIRQMDRRFWGSESAVWKVEVLVLENLEEIDEELSRIRKAMPALRLFKFRRWSTWRKEEEEVAGAVKGKAAAAAAKEVYAPSLFEVAGVSIFEVARVAQEEELVEDVRNMIQRPLNSTCGRIRLSYSLKFPIGPAILNSNSGVSNLFEVARAVKGKEKEVYEGEGTSTREIQEISSE